MKKILLLIAICGVFVAGSDAALAQAMAGDKHPAGVPADYLITPFGYFHPSCVVHLADGDELRSDDKAIRHADGTSSKMAECAYAHYRGDGERVVGDEKNIRNPDISHSWIGNASVTTKSSYGYLYGEWSVPPTPASKDGQTVYYFPGLEDIDHVVTILQPVLGWNGDYASAWGIASWNCCEKGTTYEATPHPVKSGDTILGYMFANCNSGTKCKSWDVVTLDLQNGKYSELKGTSNFGQVFNWAFGGAVEVYNIKQCSDFPSNGGDPGSHSISFNELGLFTNTYDKIDDPDWSVSTTSGLKPQCNYGGSLPKQVILNY